MGTTQSGPEAKTNLNRQFKVLAIHGWRTSGDILFKQTFAFRHHTSINATVVDAPHPARGDPDEGIAYFYPNTPYYEWYYEDFGKLEGLESSIKRLIDHISLHGPYDAILGFSQGASMATILAIIQQPNDPRLNGKKLCRAMILIGGVDPPPPYSVDGAVIQIPSLHLIGDEDPYKDRCHCLVNYYAANKRTIITYPEGHNIPSIRTNIYPQILDWLRKNIP